MYCGRDGARRSRGRRMKRRDAASPRGGARRPAEPRAAVERRPYREGRNLLRPNRGRSKLRPSRVRLLQRAGRPLSQLAATARQLRMEN